MTRHELRVLTLNCWFDDYEQDTRAEGLRKLIIDSAADIVMLQEVVPKLVRFLAARLAELLLRSLVGVHRHFQAGG